VNDTPIATATPLVCATVVGWSSASGRGGFRLKGRVVIVGDVGLKLSGGLSSRRTELVVSRSYGRPTTRAEVHGTDYPLPYVRWTERRNMASFLDQSAEERSRSSPDHNSPSPGGGNCV
jgi:hypothetical protein